MTQALDIIVFLWGYGAFTFHWVVIASIADDVFVGRKRKQFMESKQLDLMSALYRFEKEEEEAVRTWWSFVKNLQHTKRLVQLCRHTNINTTYMWVIDDALLYAGVVDHTLTESQQPLREYVDKIINPIIYIQLHIELDKVKDNVAALKVPTLPHKDSGIILAREKVVSCINELKKKTNDL